MQVPETANGFTWARAAATFVLGFCGVAALLHLGIRHPLALHADIRSEKLAMLAQWQDTAQSAVFGSSHLHMGFDARSFDHALSQPDASTPAIATRTVNLAIEGGSQTEQRAMALQFVEHLRPASNGGACLVLLELNAGANFGGPHLVHPRTINLYDWKAQQLVAHLSDPSLPRQQRFGRIGFAIAALAMHEANVGMLADLIFAPPLDQEMIADQTRDDRRGLRIEPYSPRDHASLVQELATAPSAPSVESLALTPGNRDLVSELIAANHAPGAAFLYIVSPKISDTSTMPQYPESIAVDGNVVPILNMARPDRFPALYRQQLWHDDAHLNAAGAALWSTLLGQQVRAWYAAHGGAPRCGD